VQCQVARGPYRRIKASLQTATGETSPQLVGEDSAIRATGSGIVTVEQARGLKSATVQDGARCKSQEG
jgi:hypothetical protein